MSIASPAAPSRIRLLLVDDHPLLRDGLAALIARTDDIEVCGEAASGREAIEQFARLRPDVTLMDLQMPDMGGVDAIHLIRAADPAARIVVLTTYASDVLATRALKAGAMAYVLKEVARKELLGTIRAVHARDPRARAGGAAAADPGDEGALSAREREVLALIAAGRSNKSIALELAISEETVKTHLKNIRLKLGAHDRAHAVALGHERGLIR
jgi:DNA-binding NarL/FixJ family response regulator